MNKLSIFILFTVSPFSLLSPFFSHDQAVLVSRMRQDLSTSHIAYATYEERVRLPNCRTRVQVSRMQPQDQKEREPQVTHLHQALLQRETEVEAMLPPRVAELENKNVTEKVPR
jgi:hypothetical protein